MAEHKSIDYMKHDEKLTLTPREVAEMVGIGINKAYELAHAKGAPVITIGRRRLFVRSKFIEWLENNIGSEF